MISPRGGQYEGGGNPSGFQTHWQAGFGAVSALDLVDVIHAQRSLVDVGLDCGARKCVPMASHIRTLPRRC